MILTKFLDKLNFKVVLVLLFSFMCLFSFAQDNPTDFIDDVVDNNAPAAPIDSWLFPLLLVGTVFAFYFYKKKSSNIKL